MGQEKLIIAEKTLFDVLRDVWRAKIYIFVFTATLIFCAFVFIGSAQKFYQAELIISPVIGLATSSISPPYSSDEGAINAQAGDVHVESAFARFSAIYDGMSVAKILINDDRIVAGLRGDYPFVFSKPKEEWSAAEFSSYLSQRIVLDGIHGTKMRRLRYQHPKKEFASYMLERIHLITDEIIRARITRDVQARITYLSQALIGVQNPAHKRNLAALLMEQERLKMMVSIDGQPFSASIVEPSSVSAKPSWPDPFMIYPVFILVGCLLGFVVFGVRHNV